MNNRGEQLEKHEIIKARLLSTLHSSDTQKDNLTQLLVNTIWQACANMNQYVQYGFESDLRYRIFSKNLIDFELINFNELLGAFEQYNTKKNINLDRNCNSINNKETNGTPSDLRPTLNNILFDSQITISNPHKKPNVDDNDETYYSIIDFSNLLLYVLNITVNADDNDTDTYQVNENSNISLDDKQLINQFDNHIFSLEDNKKKTNQARKFIYTLLKTKFLFDQYIIKRNTQEKKGHWTLEKLYNEQTEDKKNKNSTYWLNSFEYNLNSRLVMLQSAFHASTPTMNYKYWLSSSLLYLYHSYNKTHESLNNEYLEYLEGLAKAFMLKRYLPATQNELSIVVKNYYENFKQCNIKTYSPLPTLFSIKQILYILSYQNVRIFVFNYLDYLIWSRCELPSEVKKKFRFTTQDSIEHFYPQNPIQDSSDHNLDSNIHRFGNLCLISSGLNSRVSNHLPIAKKEYYDKAFEKQVDSLKLFKMIEVLGSDKAEWGMNQILGHEKEMFALFENALNIKIEDVGDE